MNPWNIKLGKLKKQLRVIAVLFAGRISSLLPLTVWIYCIMNKYSIMQCKPFQQMQIICDWCYFVLFWKCTFISRMFSIRWMFRSVLSVVFIHFSYCGEFRFTLIKSVVWTLQMSGNKIKVQYTCRAEVIELWRVLFQTETSSSSLALLDNPQKMFTAWRKTLHVVWVENSFTAKWKRRQQAHSDMTSLKTKDRKQQNGEKN